jgi:hypothetical protein
MSEFLALVFITLIAPILSLAIALSLVFTIYSFLKKTHPNFAKIREAFVSALLLEFQFLFTILIVGIIFSSRTTSGYTYAGPVILLLGTTLIGAGGFLYFVIRGIPKWCQWGTWWRLILWSPRDN